MKPTSRHGRAWCAGFVLLAWVGTGCGEDGAGGGGGTTPAAGGGGSGGGSDQCSPGEVELADGTCRPAGPSADLPTPGPTAPPQAGVPPDACGAGFDSDGEGGCVPVLPTTPCAPGQMAVPGDATCRPIGSCGTGTWGDIPVQGNTQYVDGTFGGTSDGSVAHPWTTVQAGIDAAEAGATVAIAAGQYVEDLTITGKAVVVFGRCPDLVELQAQSAARVVVVDGAPGTEIRSLAVTGASRGLYLVDSGGAVLDRLWLHDLEATGIAIGGSGAETVVSGTLIDGVRLGGIVLGGSEVAVDRSEVRHVLPELGTDTKGRGIEAAYNPTTGQRASLRVEGSWIHDTHDVGVLAIGADLQMDRSVIRDTAPAPAGTERGFGVMVADLEDQLATGDIARSVIEGNQNSGIHVVAGEVTVDATTVQLTTPGNGADAGYGIYGMNSLAAPVGADVTVLRSVVRDNADVAVLVLSSTVHLERTLVQRTAAAGSGFFGHGLYVGGPASAASEGLAVVQECLFEDHHDIAIFAHGGQVHLEQSVVRGTQPMGDGSSGVGAAALEQPAYQQPGTLTVMSSLIEHNRMAGIMVGSSSGHIESTVIRDVLPQASDDHHGYGLFVATVPGATQRGSATASGLLVEQAHEHGVLVLGADLDLEEAVVRDTEVHPGGYDLGRGIALQPGEGGDRPGAAIRWSLVEGNRDLGIAAWSADVTIEGCVVRGTRPTSLSNEWGGGILVAVKPSVPAPSEGVILGSLVEDVRVGGVTVDGSVVTVASTLVRDIDGQASDGAFGRGINVQGGATVTITGSRVEGCRDVGIVFHQATGMVTATAVSDVAPNVADGLFGDGVTVLSNPEASPVTISGSLIANTARAGVTTFGGFVQLGDSRLECNPIDLDRESYLGVTGGFLDLGGNGCGCGDSAIHCAVKSTGMTPPEPLP